jgi:hypothetical protein
MGGGKGKGRAGSPKHRDGAGRSVGKWESNGITRKPEGAAPAVGNSLKFSGRLGTNFGR